jgi:hypothetical protein
MPVASTVETVSPRLPLFPDKFLLLEQLQAWLIVWRDTPSIRPSSSWRIRRPGAGVPSAIASTTRS